jgi:molecular chaperone GrpE
VTEIPKEETEEKTQKVDSGPEELTESQKEQEELEERLLRLRADFDNFRKRSRQQLAEARSLATEAFAFSLLPVIDNLQRALQAASGEAGGFKTGVEMIYKQLLDVLAAEEIKPIEAVGKSFDPYLHEAVAVQETDQFPEGTVTEELLRGYLIGEKVLRHSKVKVAQGLSTGKDEAKDE